MNLELVMEGHMTQQAGSKRYFGYLVLSLCLIYPAPARAQAPSPPRSPKEVLEAYRKLDAEGGRLSAGGWYKASEFFVKPARPPQQYVLLVVRGERMWDRPMSVGGEDRVRIDVDCDALGQIDSLGRFTSLVGPSLIDPSGRPVLRPKPPFVRGPASLAMVYYLVLSDTYWEFGLNQEGPREVKGPPEWRIETFGYEPTVTIETAIRYLTKLLEESNSEVTRKNANKSIAMLRQLR